MPPVDGIGNSESNVMFLICDHTIVLYCTVLTLVIFACLIFLWQKQLSLKSLVFSLKSLTISANLS